MIHTDVHGTLLHVRTIVLVTARVRRPVIQAIISDDRLLPPPTGKALDKSILKPIPDQGVASVNIGVYPDM